MACLSVLLLCYRITGFWFCNKKGRYLCQTLYNDSLSHSYCYFCHADRETEAWGVSTIPPHAHRQERVKFRTRGSHHLSSKRRHFWGWKEGLWEMTPANTCKGGMSQQARERGRPSFEPVFLVSKPSFSTLTLLIPRKVMREIWIQLSPLFVTVLLADSFPSSHTRVLESSLNSVLLRSPMGDSDVLPGMGTRVLETVIFEITKSLSSTLVSS